MAAGQPASARAGVFYPETYQLSNGLRIIIVKNKLSPAVAQMLWYEAGGVDSPLGSSGVAHYLEHLMFRGTKHVLAGGFSAWVASQGGQDNAFTSQDATAYHAIVAPDRLGMLMQLEADRMRHLDIRDETALAELRVVQSERQERTDNSPEGVFGEKLNAALFPQHPYGTPVIGSREDLAVMTPAKALAFYETHYAPDKAVLVISGAVETQDVLRLAAGTFGRVPASDSFSSSAIATSAVKKTSGAAQGLAWPVKPAKGLETRVEMADARVKSPQFHHLILADSARVSAHRAAALDVLAEVLGGEVGVLYRRLARGAKIAASVDVSYDSMARGPAVFHFSGIPASGVSDLVLEEGVSRILRALAARGVAPQEVRAAKERLQNAAIFARDSLMAPCHVFGQTLTTGGRVADVETWPALIARVTPADVTQALRRLLQSPHHVTGWLRPAGDHR